jgi:hypothetical protein
MRATAALDVRTLLAAALVLAAPLPGTAQSPPPGLREVREGATVGLGFGIVAAVPVGEFGRLVNGAGGVSASLALHLGRGAHTAVLLEGSYLQYGQADRPVPLASGGGLLAVDARTRFYVASLRVGPQLTFGSGRLRPYAFGTAGAAYFATQTSLGPGCGCRTTNYDDTALSLAAGGGVRLVLSGGGHPAALDLGAGFVRNGRVSYVRETDIVENPDGSYTVYPVRSEADFATLHVGLSVGL